MSYCHYHPAATASSACSRAHQQAGAATLAVVMLLFFVVSLAAAYASRNLIFEQRTSANQLRSTQSVEAAEAGIEWAIAMLSSGKIDANCVQSTSAAAGIIPFRDRYLTINAVNGTIARVPNSNPLSTELWAACTLLADGTWSCSCPTGDLVANPLVPGQAAFAVRFLPTNGTPRASAVRIEVNGCNSYDLACLTNVALVNNFRCHSTLCAMLVLHSAIKQVPEAALTARQGISGTALTVTNTDPVTRGLTVHAGGAAGGGIVITSVSTPGTPGSASQVFNDPALQSPQLLADADGCGNCLFTSTFGLRRETYRRQTAVTPLDCSAGCTATQVNLALASQRSRIVWLSGAGGLTLSSAGDIIGTAASPVVLVVEGPLAMSSTPTIYGAVYAGSVAIDGGLVRGALLSANAVTANGSGQVIYDPAILTRLHYTSGSFVRLPGSWRDFP